LTEELRNWAIIMVGSWLLIFCIHFSPTLRSIFAHPHFVFLGSISFGMYLIHGFLMRSTLAWIMYGLLPEPDGAGSRVNSDVHRLTWDVIDSIIFMLWMIPLIYLSKLWRDYVDPMCIKFALVAEEVFLGKRALLETIGAVGFGTVDYMLRANPHELKVMRAMEGGSKE